MQRARDVHCDDTSHAAQSESARGSQLLSWSNIALCQLLQRCVAREPHRRVGGLPRCGRNKALEEASDSSLLEDDFTAVQESAHARVRRFAVVNSETITSVSSDPK